MELHAASPPPEGRLPRRWCWQAVVGGVVLPVSCFVVGAMFVFVAVSFGPPPLWVLGATFMLLPLASLLLGIAAAVRIHRSAGALKGKVFTLVAIWFGSFWLLGLLGMAVD